MCSLCENNSKFHKNFLRPDEYCILCGCTLTAKTKCLSCCCDVHKWEAVVTEQQEEEMNDGKE